MVSFTTIYGTYDGVLFEELPNSEFKAQAARVSKSKTLDGGVYIDHRGFVHGDREFRIKAVLTAAQEILLTDIARNETFVNLSCIEGFFKGVIPNFEIDNGNLDLTFWVKNKLNS